MIRKAEKADIAVINEIYLAIHSAEEAGLIRTGWIRGIYPTEETACNSVARSDMFVTEENGEVLGAAIVNRQQGQAYSLGKWEFAAEDEEIMVLHTLVIHPKAARRGLGKSMVRFYEQYALEKGCHVLRLDTNAVNAAARAMYKALGYSEAGTVPCEFNGIPDVRLVLLEKRM